MTRQSAKQRILNGTMVILVLGAFVTIAFAPWAQPVRTSIAKHAPEIAMHMIVDHFTKQPKVPKVYFKTTF